MPCFFQSNTPEECLWQIFSGTLSDCAVKNSLVKWLCASNYCNTSIDLQIQNFWYHNQAQLTHWLSFFPSVSHSRSCVTAAYQRQSLGILTQHFYPSTHIVMPDILPLPETSFGSHPDIWDSLGAGALNVSPCECNPQWHFYMLSDPGHGKGKRGCKQVALLQRTQIHVCNMCINWWNDYQQV